jgi:methanogenic corrinoid protein MtbC1
MNTEILSKIAEQTELGKVNKAIARGQDGAPVSQSFADKIGASGYSSNPQGAVALLNRLIA